MIDLKFFFLSMDQTRTGMQASNIKIFRLTHDTYYNSFAAEVLPDGKH